MILFTINRSKKAGFWCQYATEDSTEFLGGISADINTPVDLMAAADFPTVGISNAMMCLSGVLDRYKEEADRVLIEFCKVLIKYTNAKIPEDSPIGQIPDKFMQHETRAKKIHAQLWDYMVQNPEMPPKVRHVYRTAELLYNTKYPLNVRAAHAYKYLILAYHLLDPDVPLREMLLEELKEIYYAN